MAPQTSIKLTYEDYAAIPDDGRRHEIIDGEHYVNPAPNVLHQIILSNIELALQQFVRAHRAGRVLPPALDVVLNVHDIVQPDLVFIGKSRAQIIKEKNIQGAPDLVVEILSDSNRRYDKRVKYDIYERGGVAEYWIVDPGEYTVNVYRRVGDKFTAVEIGNAITTPLLPGFTLPLTTIFEM
jgi:Uma2 family endonuclease